ncbi:MAG TPA: hypothetical protein VK809_04135 [Bacteroidia bacterium]|jgi:hypothetical protein|nr:hypothetical protein [Bacteroidia bacterium]
MSNDSAEIKSNALELFFSDLKIQLITELKQTLLNEIKGIVKQEIQLEMLGLKEAIIIEEYMPVKYFLQKYEFSRETFRRIYNSGMVHSYYKTGRKIYQVEQFKKALEAYKPQKPVFQKILRKIA